VVDIACLLTSAASEVMFGVVFSTWCIAVLVQVLWWLDVTKNGVGFEYGWPRFWVSLGLIIILTSPVLINQFYWSSSNGPYRPAVLSAGLLMLGFGLMQSIGERFMQRIIFSLFWFLIVLAGQFASFSGVLRDAV